MRDKLIEYFRSSVLLATIVCVLVGIKQCKVGRDRANYSLYAAINKKADCLTETIGSSNESLTAVAASAIAAAEPLIGIGISYLEDLSSERVLAQKQSAVAGYLYQINEGEMNADITSSCIQVILVDRSSNYYSNVHRLDPESLFASKDTASKQPRSLSKSHSLPLVFLEFGIERDLIYPDVKLRPDITYVRDTLSTNLLRSPIDVEILLTITAGGDSTVVIPIQIPNIKRNLEGNPTQTIVHTSWIKGIPTVHNDQIIIANTLMDSLGISSLPLLPVSFIASYTETSSPILTLSLLKNIIVSATKTYE